MSKRIHSLEGREKHVRELGNVAHGKQELTCWRGGRGRSGLASSEMWHIANKVPSWGRKREEWVSELGNMAHCKTGDSLAGGEEERGAGWRAWKRGMLQNGDSLAGGEEEGGVGW